MNKTRRKTPGGKRRPPPAGESSEIRHLKDRLAAVRAIGEALSTAVGLDDLFLQVVPNVSRLMNAERSTLFLRSTTEGEIWSKVAEGEGQEIRLKVGEGIAGTVAQTRQATFINDAYSDERFNRSVDQRTGFRTRSVAAAPLTDRAGDLLGVLQVLNKKSGHFTQDDLGLLETIAVQTSYAVENARQAQSLIDQNKELVAARERAERRRAELDLLYQLEKETSASTNLDALLDSVIVQACDRLRSEAGSVLLIDRDSGKLFFRGVSGEKGDALRRLALNPGEGVVGWVAQHKRPLIVNRPQEDTRHDRQLARKIDYEAGALLAVPLIWDNEVIGAVEVLNPRPRSTGAVGYDQEDLKVLTLIAAQVARAVALTRARQERIQTERLAYLGRMLAGVAHDLRNPMTVISGYAQIMALEDDADARATRCDKVLTQIDEMTAMISDLLAFARGDSKLRPAAVALDALKKEVEDALSVHCSPRGIHLSVTAQAGQLMLDPARAKRIIHNLAKNSVDVLSRNGSLAVNLSVHERQLLIEVRDTGPGIPNEVLSRLFDPFFTANKEGGTGLGLSIVKRFVEDHRGEIRVESTPGEGTSFHVVLPEISDVPQEENVP